MISVIMPVFNREKTIQRAIDSVLNQTYKNIELIIVDDCSTDNTSKIIKSYNDVRIKYIKLEKNSGACIARNVGIMNSKGEYVAFQDSDDEWLLDKLEKQILNINQSESDLDFCMFRRITNKNINILPNKQILHKINKYGITKSLRFGNYISTQLILAKKECFKEINFDSQLPRLQDYDLILRISEKFKVSFTKEILANVYLQDDSISKSDEKLIKAINIMLEKEYSFQNLLQASLYRDLGNMYADKKDKINAKKFYKMSLLKKFKFKIFVKYILIFLK